VTPLSTSRLSPTLGYIILALICTRLDKRMGLRAHSPKRERPHLELRSTVGTRNSLLSLLEGWFYRITEGHLCPDWNERRSLITPYPLDEAHSLEPETTIIGLASFGFGCARTVEPCRATSVASSTAIGSTYVALGVPKESPPLGGTSRAPSVCPEAVRVCLGLTELNAKLNQGEAK